MKIGFYLGAYLPDVQASTVQLYSDMLEQARMAESIGMSSLWIPEHHFMNLLLHPNPLMSAIKVASVTKQIPIVTAVLVLPFFDMRRLAGEITLADHLTDGRIEIGVGRGAFKYEFDRFNVSIDESRANFDESLALLQRLLTEYDVSSNTDLYRFAPLTVMPRPLQKPHPRIWMAAVTPTAIYHSARRGFDVMTTPLRSPFEDAMKQAEAFLAGAAEAPAPKPRMATLRMAYVARDRRDVAEKVGFAYTNDQRHHNVRSGEGEINHGDIVPHETGRTLEQVESALIIGSAEECARKLVAYSNLGISEMILNMAFGASHRDVMRSLERFARDVVPLLPTQEVKDALRA